MRLQEFITETLKAYIAGVKEAQEYASEQGAAINPRADTVGTTKSDLMIVHGRGLWIRNVEFDVAVTSSEENEAKGGAGIFVAGIGLGAQGRTDTSSSSISRIKFVVPVALPQQIDMKE